MYIGNDAYGVYWEFGGEPGWSMVERDVGSSKAFYDGRLNEKGVDLLLKKFNLVRVRGVTPDSLRMIKPEEFEMMRANAAATL